MSWYTDNKWHRAKCNALSHLSCASLKKGYYTASGDTEEVFAMSSCAPICPHGPINCTTTSCVSVLFSHTAAQY